MMKAKVIGIDGKYAITDNGQRLRIIGDAVPRGSVYSDGVVAYGYSVKSNEMIRIPRRRGGSHYCWKWYDVVLTVNPLPQLGFIGDFGGVCAIGYPYKHYESYYPNFDRSQSIILPYNDARYVISGNKLFSIRLDGYDWEYINHVYFYEFGANVSATWNVPNLLISDWYYDVGRGGQIAIVGKGFSGGWIMAYVSGSDVTEYTYNRVQQLVFNQGDFNVPDSSYIAIDVPYDLNVDDSGNASAVICASYNYVYRYYVIGFDDNGISIADYDYANCGDGKGVFTYDERWHTGSGTIEYTINGKRNTVNGYSGDKITVTTDYAFHKSGDKVYQYDEDGQLIRTFEFWDAVNNCRLDLYDVDALLRAWGIRRKWDISYYFDTRIEVLPVKLRFDARLTVC